MAYTHLRKEIFPKGAYNKISLKKIGPCIILNKFSNNAYVLEFPQGIGLSTKFNVFDLHKFKEGSTSDGKVIYDLLRQILV